MNDPKDIRARMDSAAGTAGGTPPAGGTLDETMGGTDNTADDSAGRAREAAGEQARREGGADRP